MTFTQCYYTVDSSFLGLPVLLKMSEKAPTAPPPKKKLDDPQMIIRELLFQTSYKKVCHLESKIERNEGWLKSFESIVYFHKAR